MQPPALPHGEVGVLQRKVRQRRGAPLDVAPVEGFQLAQQDAQRPAIGDDVVHGEEQDVLSLVEARQRRPQQRPPEQVERAPGLRLRPVACAAGARSAGGRWLRSTSSIRAGAGRRPGRPAGPRRRDDLHGLPLDHPDGRAQRFVAAHDVAQGRVQGVDPQGPAELHRGRHVVGRAAGLELGQEPQALLGEGQRQRLLPRGGRDGGPCPGGRRRPAPPGGPPSAPRTGAAGAARRRSVAAGAPSGASPARSAPPARRSRRARRRGAGRAPPPTARPAAAPSRCALPPPGRRGGRAPAVRPARPAGRSCR